MSFDQLREQRDCRLTLVLGQPPKQGTRSDQHVPGTKVLGRAVLRTNAFGFHQLWLDGSHNLPGDLVLKRKDVGQLAIVTVGPEVLAADGIDQLGGNPYAVAALADAPFQDVAHPEFAPDLTYVHGPTFVGE